MFIAPIGGSLARLAAAGRDGTEELDRLSAEVRAWAQGIDRYVFGYTGMRPELRAPIPAQPVFRPLSLTHAWEDPAGWLVWVNTAVDEGLRHIDRLLDASAVEPPRQARDPRRLFDELRVAGLVHGDQLAGYIARMSRIRSKREISEAIGASKELIEACYLAACDLLELPIPAKSDFPKLGKTVRAELVRRAMQPRMTRKATDAIVQLGSGLGTVDDALAALRNELGTGHGRVNPPAGLKPFHAELAIDAAEMQSRYLVSVLRELGLLAD